LHGAIVISSWALGGRPTESSQTQMSLIAALPGLLPYFTSESSPSAAVVSVLLRNDDP
jgi:hypothetical protein